jgi:hypothetical protein
LFKPSRIIILDILNDCRDRSRLEFGQLLGRAGDLISVQPVDYGYRHDCRLDIHTVAKGGELKALHLDVNNAGLLCLV